MSRFRAAMAALVIGLGTGTSVWVFVNEVTDPEFGIERPAPGDRVQEAVEALADSHVHLAADAHDLLAPEQAAELDRAAAELDTDLRIVVWERTRQAGYYLDSDAAGQIAHELDLTGHLAIWSGPGQGFVLDRGVRTRPAVPHDFHGDPALRLAEIIDALDAAEVETHTDEFWGGPVSITVTVLLFALLLLGSLLLLIGLGRVVLGRPWRMRGGWW